MDEDFTFYRRALSDDELLHIKDAVAHDKYSSHTQSVYTVSGLAGCSNTRSEATVSGLLGCSMFIFKAVAYQFLGWLDVCIEVHLPCVWTQYTRQDQDYFHFFVESSCVSYRDTKETVAYYGSKSMHCWIW